MNDAVLLKYPDLESAPEGEDLLVVSRRPCGGYSVEIRTRHRHTERAACVHDYFSRLVLPNAGDTVCDASGVYPISLEDACDRAGVLCFSRRKEDRSVLMPDLYQMGDYDGLLQRAPDAVPYEAKLDRVVFAGASTGDLEPERNERLAASLWSRDHRGFTDFFITNLCQVSEHAVVDYVGGRGVLDEILRPHMPREDQLAYRYVMSIDGNSTSWDRPAWVMRSNSVLFKLRSARGFINWYDDLWQPGEHFVDVPSLHDLPAIFHARTAEADRAVMREASWFVTNVMANRSAHVMYTVEVLGQAQWR